MNDLVLFVAGKSDEVSHPWTVIAVLIILWAIFGGGGKGDKGKKQ